MQIYEIYNKLIPFNSSSPNRIYYYYPQAEKWYTINASRQNEKAERFAKSIRYTSYPVIPLILLLSRKLSIPKLMPRLLIFFGGSIMFFILLAKLNKYLHRNLVLSECQAPNNLNNLLEINFRQAKFSSIFSYFTLFMYAVFTFLSIYFDFFAGFILCWTLESIILLLIFNNQHKRKGCLEKLIKENKSINTDNTED